MIKVAIVEDSAADAKVLASYIESKAAERGRETVSCTVYSDAVKFLEKESTSADIVFMDIEMPYLNGLDAAAEFRKCNQEAVLIFATRATKYAVRGYAVDAIGYLVKPVGEKAFSEVFEKAMRLYQDRTRQQTIVLKTKDGMTKISTDRIRYIEASSHMLNIDTGDNVYRIWSGIDKMLEELPEEFVCCHRGYIVNLKHVDSVKKDGLCIVGRPELLIPISRQKRAEFIEKLTRYYAQTMRG